MQIGVMSRAKYYKKSLAERISFTSKVLDLLVQLGGLEGLDEGREAFFRIWLERLEDVWRDRREENFVDDVNDAVVELDVALLDDASVDCQDLKRFTQCTGQLQPVPMSHQEAGCQDVRRLAIPLYEGQR